ncbi:hypothetical protein [Mucilaginibacter myungsuensis]|uniref:Uncharacterized protein n=1 Tax=Mucilaginibacter myungsuensis TaxID=649104 RepID=A0A929PZN6_9SPHI|nr:hypothetical protein [Mucilaginibacter myungsuensis]MBE9664612.1 hypothetical protein [Mucilaginibacter myungsuensis]MDN3601498.1 hypothetical protein [Mucilaginibacter myungsuensis]
MGTIKPLLRWLLVTVLVWISGAALIRIGYANINDTLREFCQVTGYITVLGATVAIVAELLIIATLSLFRKQQA